MKKCDQLVKFYDRDNDGKLVYKNFLRMILPLNNSQLRGEVAKRDIVAIKDNEFLPYNIEYALSQLIIKEFASVEGIEADKLSLLNRYDFSIQSSFKLIDLRHLRYITFESLSAFLKKLQSGAQKEDLIAFMRRVDQDLDCQISFNEFVDAFSPLEGSAQIKPSYVNPTKAFQGEVTRSTLNESSMMKRKHKKSQSLGKFSKRSNTSMRSKRNKKLSSIKKNETQKIKTSLSRIYPKKEKEMIFKLFKEQLSMEIGRAHV